MRVMTCLLADFASTGDGGKLNLMGVFDRIFASQFPAAHPMMCLVVRILHEYEDSESSHDLHIKMEGPDGAAIIEINGKAEVGTLEPGAFGTANQIIQLQGVDFPKSGTYMVRVKIDGSQAYEMPLSVMKGTGKS